MVRDDGIIEVEAGVPGGILDHALNDAVTSSAPTGARHPGLSTYWIDRTEREIGVASALREGPADELGSPRTVRSVLGVPSSTKVTR